MTQQAVTWRIAESLGRQAALPVMTGTLADASIDITFAGDDRDLRNPRSKLLALLGAETDTKLRASYSPAGLRGLSFEQITVRKT